MGQSEGRHFVQTRLPVYYQRVLRSKGGERASQLRVCPVAIRYTHHLAAGPRRVGQRADYFNHGWNGQPASDRTDVSHRRVIRART